MGLSKVQLEAFRRDGFTLVEGLFPAERMAAALAETEQIFYGKSFAAYLAEFDATGAAPSTEPQSTAAVPHYGETEFGRPQFPTGAPTLDSLIEDEDYLDIFEQCLGSAASYCNAHLFLRCGPSDARHAEHPWQGYHMDHFTNSFLPPSGGAFDYVNSVIYLHDVEEEGAAMRVMPGSHRQAVELFGRLSNDPILNPGNIDDVRTLPELAAPIATSAPAGSALFYSSYLVHGAVPFEDKRRQRAFWTLSMARADNSTWSKLATPWVGSERAVFKAYWQQTTPHVRSLFGWPPPGHPYYDWEILANLAAMYPEMDLTPYSESG